MKIGMGYDVHRLVLKRKLILGGVKIPFEKHCYSEEVNEVSGSFCYTPRTSSLTHHAYRKNRSTWCIKNDVLGV